MALSPLQEVPLTKATASQFLAESRKAIAAGAAAAVTVLVAGFANGGVSSAVIAAAAGAFVSAAILVYLVPNRAPVAAPSA